MHRWKLAAIACLLVPLSIAVVLQTSSRHSRDLPPGEVPDKNLPQVTSELPWSDFLSAANLQAEMTRIQNDLKATLASVGTYNSNYKAISVDGTVIAALSGIAIEHPGEIDWKANAPVIRDLGLELAKASSGLGREKYTRSKAAFDRLESAFRGTNSTETPKPVLRRPFHETVSRAGAMKRIEIARNRLRDTITSADALKTEQEAISRDSQLISTFGHIIATQGYPGADEQYYQEYAAELVSSIEGVSVAARDLNLQKFRSSMTRVSKSCDQCHANYGADDSPDLAENGQKIDFGKLPDLAENRQKIDVDKLPDLIADRLKRKIVVDFKRTPLQEAFAFIGAEIKTKFTIDGEALKSGGFTKNMPQTFQGDMTVLDAIKTILGKYQDPQKPSQTMVIVVDEATKSILVSTKAFCEQQKLIPYELFAAPIPANSEGVGTLRGRVLIEGTFAPLPALVAREADTKDSVVCGGQAIPDESILVKDGGVANVFIYLENAPMEGKSAYFQGAAELELKNCLFAPRAMVVVTNRAVSVLNNDALTHRVLTHPSENPAVNMLIEPNDCVGAKLIYTVAEKQPLCVDCDTRAWMRAYHLPLDHSFADVSQADGKFAITHLPVGRHEFKVWHEVGKFLENSLAVNIKPGDNEITIKIPAARLAR